MAEGMAFNTAPIDLSGDIWRDDPPGWMRDHLDFHQDQRARFGHAATVADCAVLHNFESLSCAATYPQESLVLGEQSLLQGGVAKPVGRGRVAVIPDVNRPRSEASARGEVR